MSTFRQIGKRSSIQGGGTVVNLYVNNVMSSVNPFNVFGNDYFITAVINALENNTVFIENLITPAVRSYVAAQLQDNDVIVSDVYNLLLTDIENDKTVDGFIMPATEIIINYFIPPVITLLDEDTELINLILENFQQYIPTIEKSVSLDQITAAAISFINYLNSSVSIVWFTNVLNSSLMIQSTAYTKSLQNEIQSQSVEITVPPFVLYNNMFFVFFQQQVAYLNIMSIRFPSLVLTSSVPNSISRVIVHIIDLYDLNILSNLQDTTYSPAVTSTALSFTSSFMNEVGSPNKQIKSDINTYNITVCLALRMFLLNGAYVTSTFNIVVNKSTTLN